MIPQGDLRRFLTNPALLIGIVAVLTLFALGVFGQFVTPFDPNAGRSLLIRALPNGANSFAVPPTPPDQEHWLGTDVLGRDQWSRILAGARLTLTVVLAAALARLGLGFTLGVVTGWYGGFSAAALRALAAGVTAVPQLLLAITFVLVTRDFGVLGFIASLALVGWPEIVEYVDAEVARAKVEPFIEAAQAIGTPPRRLVTTHLVSALGPRLLTLATLEIGSVLLLLAELGLIGLFLAGATFLVGDRGPGALQERAPEWSQMLGGIQFYAMQDQISLLFPALFVVLATASFGLLSDGLRAASDPFSPSCLRPATFSSLAKVMAVVLCVSTLGFVTANVPRNTLSMDEGRELAAKTAASVWPGSDYVAGVVRYSSEAHGLDRPDRITYYYRKDAEIMRISFLNGDPLGIEVRMYESEDEIDFTALRPLPNGLPSWDKPIAQADQKLGLEFRQANPNYLLRAIVTWPNDRDAPVYLITYGTGPGQLAMRSACCFDAKTAESVPAVAVPHLDPPYAVADCPVTPTEVQMRDPSGRRPGYFAFGSGLAVGSMYNLYFEGDNAIQISLANAAGIPRVVNAVNLTTGSGLVSIVNTPSVAPGNANLGSGTIRITGAGCWKIVLAVGDIASLEYVVYAYPWTCRPPQLTGGAPPPGVVIGSCVKP